MKTSPLLLICLLLYFGASAQTPTYRHSLGVGFERVGLDAPDAIGNRYLLRYARHLHHDRVVLMGNMGYMSVRNRVYLPGTTGQYVEGKRRQRVTTDLTAAFDFVRHPRHAFRLGVGPSLWYRQEERSQGVRYTVRSDGSVADVQAAWRAERAFDVGFNVLVEYEYALTNQFLISGKLKFVDLNKAEQSTIYGGGIGYLIH